MVTLHFSRYHSKQKVETKTIKDAVGIALYMLEETTGFPTKITHNKEIIWNYSDHKDVSLSLEELYDELNSQIKEE